MDGKIYPFVAINKSNMKQLQHYKDADLLSLALCNKEKSFNYSNWIVVKNEEVVLDLSSVRGNMVEQYKQIKQIAQNS